MELPRRVSDILQIADIALDSYDDLFSDFDPSPYTTRILSEDFTNELHRRYSFTGKGRFEVNFTLPRRLRSEKTEQLVRKRIRDHFKDRLRSLERSIADKRRRGALRVALGVAISVPLLLFKELDIIPVLTIASVLMWYSIWSGFELVFEASARLSRKKAFYDKFAAAEYNFVSQEDVVQTICNIEDATPPAGRKSQGSS